MLMGICFTSVGWTTSVMALSKCRAGENVQQNFMELDKQIAKSTNHTKSKVLLIKIPIPVYT